MAGKDGIFGGFGDIFDGIGDLGARAGKNAGAALAGAAKAVSEAKEEGVQAGFRLAVKAAANKARVLGYETLAKDIEGMSIQRKK